MADRTKEPPRDHVIEPARSDRSSCQLCHQPIVVGELRFAEAYVSSDGAGARAVRNARTPKPRAYDSGYDDYGGGYQRLSADVWQRFYHLRCAAADKPAMLARTLAMTTIDIPERAQLLAIIDEATTIRDAAARDPATRDDYERFATRLRAAIDDELVLVFGDWLQSVGDPRGELIAIDHALERATGAQRDELIARHKRLLADRTTALAVPGEAVWRRGFVSTITINQPSAIATTLAHPSLIQLRELHIESAAPVTAAMLPRQLPPTIEALELATPSSELAVIVAAVPNLRRLRLRGDSELAIAHPQLTTLELIGNQQVRRLSALAPKAVPALTELVLRAQQLDDAVELLAKARIARQLKRLVLDGDLSELAPLAASRLELDEIDLRKTRFAGQGTQIAAREVVDPPPAATPAPPPPTTPRKPIEWLVRHRRKPEWGIGRVVEESDDGLTVEFEGGGKKVVRNVELLIEVTR